MNKQKDILQRLAELSPEKRRLIDKWMKEETKHNTIQRHSAQEENIPLSFAQQRLWFFCQLEPNNCVYNMPFALDLTGQMNVRALELSLNVLIVRHEALRTVFSQKNGHPVQIITPEQKLYLPVVDLSILPAIPVQEASFQQLARQDAETPFDLQNGPLLRITLLRHHENYHIALVTVHHIIFDAWSIGVFFSELATLYTSFSSGRPFALPELPIQYGDFAIWQRDQLQGELLQSQLTYWKQHLGNDLPMLKLPTDYARPAVQSYRGSHCSTKILKPTVDALKILSQQENVTLFMMLLSLFLILLYRYTSQEDLVLGTRVANRNRRETEGVIGFFINALVLRHDLSGNPTFRELLRRIRNVTTAAFQYQDTPFEKLVEELHPQRNISYNPLFQVMFSLNKIADLSLNLPDLTIHQIAIDRQVTMFDLDFTFSEGADMLQCIVEYNSDLFDESTILRMLSHYNTLIDKILSNPDQHILDLSPVNDAERQHILAAWNNTDFAYPTDYYFYQMFAKQTMQTPDAIAVICEDAYLTYQELNRRANRFAHYLQARGACPEVSVGIHIERSLTMFIALLAVLKTGAAYVPLDPSYPPTYLEHIARDAHVTLLLTLQKYVKSLSFNLNQIEVVMLDYDLTHIAQQPEINPIIHLRPESLLYIMYTSGSTGYPKGVAIEQRQLLNRFRWMWRTFPFEYGEVTCQRTAMNSTVSFWECFGGLLQGMATVIIPDREAKDLDLLLNRLILHNVTRITLVPSLLQSILLTPKNLAVDLAHLKLWCLLGEVLTGDLYRCFQERFPNAKLINLYGSSEMYDMTYHYVDRQISERERFIPVGLPIDNVKVYILDTQMEPVPIGIPGEIYVGSRTPARGYVNMPDLTAEKFIPDPFGGQSNARLYRTGDLGRRLQDGKIEHLGRKDYLVKVRGNRVELEGISALLCELPAVKQAVVVMREDRSDERRMVAYVVFHNEQKTPLNELRRHLRERLPAFMVPALFLELEKMPLTLNGKLNRLALPAPTADRPEMETYYTPPRTAVESILVEIWMDLLHIQTVGIHDNFFDLGGHSLLATQIVSRIRDLFQIDLPLRTFLENQTIATVAEALSSALSTEILDAIKMVESLPEEDIDNEIKNMDINR